VTLHLGDCLGPDGLASLADGSVDVTLTDPPYAKVVVTTAKGAPSRNGRSGLASTRDLGYLGITEGQRDEVSAHIARVTRRWAVVFCDAESLTAWRNSLEAAGMRHARMGAWVAPNCTPQFTGDRPGTGWEACEIAHAGGVGRWRWNGGGRPAVWILPRPANGTAEREALAHPTPKPVELFEQLVRDFTDPGDLICDPFAGSGTTGVACKRLGRRFVGWERDESFWRAATKRLDAAREQLVIPLRRQAKPKQGLLGGIE